VAFRHIHPRDWRTIAAPVAEQPPRAVNENTAARLHPVLRPNSDLSGLWRNKGRVSKERKRQRKPFGFSIGNLPFSGSPAPKGAAVIMQWNDLATDVQRELFDYATSMGELRHVAELKGQIAWFLNKHKDGERNERQRP
jgi:hypothetical protein